MLRYVQQNADRGGDRFTMLLMTEHEEYLEDHACTYFRLVNSSTSLMRSSSGRTIFQATSSNDRLTSSLAKRRRSKGRLKVCSDAVYFVPDDFRGPVIRFPYKNISDKGASLFQVPAAQAGMYQGHHQLFSFVSSQTVEMKTEERNHPYRFVKGSQLHVFDLHYTSLKVFLRRLNELIYSNKQHSAASEHRRYVERLVAERERTFAFDMTWLEDLRETEIVQVRCEVVRPLHVITGRLLLTQRRVYFQPFNNIMMAKQPVDKYNLADVYRLVKRRYLMRQVGLEVFLQDNISVFFTFSSRQQRDYVYNKILEQPDIRIEESDQSNITLQWQNGLISNFDYLMYLNFMADRTFNDLTQYPVFPWIIADYTSSTLDLSDPNTFRDLSKPIGALNESRLKMFQERFREMPDTEPKFLYGTHYSTPGYVLYYLVRQAPEYMLRLQNGRFDDPDRMFHSLAETWNSVLANHADVKELIPEFYQSSGRFLMNTDNLDLGIRQNGSRVHDVELPPWAENAADFIQKNREALESEYVSKNLHHWIDLIFGYKQRGEEAVKADNLFFYLTYEGAIDFDSIADKDHREALEHQIREFGQTPKQLFSKPHPSRISTQSNPEHVKGCLEDVIPLDPVLASKQHAQASSPSPPSSSTHHVHTPSTESSHSNLNSPVSDNMGAMSLEGSGGPTPPEYTLSSLTAKNTIRMHKDMVSGCIVRGSTLYTTSHDTSAKVYNLEKGRQQRRIAGGMGEMPLSSLALPEDDNKTVVLGSWDNNIYVYSVAFGRIVDQVNGHFDAVSDISISNHKLVSGSWDASVKVWAMRPSGIDKAPLLDVAEHETEVKQVALDHTGSLAVSASTDGVAMVWDIRSNQQIHEFRVHNEEVTALSFVPYDSIRILTASSDRFVKLSQTDGAEISTWCAEEPVHSAITDGFNVVCGGESGTVKIWNMTQGDETGVVKKYNHPITCLFLRDDGHLFAGDKGGNLVEWE
eukprot:gb/GECH01001461.1/.p1 GENE.gb/GECH01001461.1/~~gb/GECH01001461.1/.p1  ORF type:complete len:977 (+),score=232.90 gb/GECH01001461.1/:1-2931(+)